MNKGIVYIIGGQKYSRWALRSVISLRQNGGKAGKLPVHVYFIEGGFYEDQFNSLGCTCILNPAKKCCSRMKEKHRNLKAFVMDNVVFDKYIMLDADTFVQNDFIDMFDQIPLDGVAGIEDGNFESHLQMAKFLFVQGKVPDVIEFVKEMLGVDYGSDDVFPPYYNVGVIGWSKTASQTVGSQLFKLLAKLQKNPNYNSHDEQLPINSIMYHNKIPGIVIDPIYNYTKSRLKKNRDSGKHDKIKDNIKIIHNRSCIESNWIDATSVEKELKYIIDENSK